MMTRLQKAATIIALALCFAVAVSGELWEASHSPPSPRQGRTAPYEQNPAKPTQEEKPDEAIARYNWWLMIFTGGLVLATAGLGIANVFQIRLSRAEFIASHRPRIILRDVHIEGRQVLYFLVNVGDTDATIVESWILGEFVPERTPLRPLYSTGHDDLGRIVIAAGETRDLTYQLPSEISFAFMYPDSTRIGINGQPPVEGKRYFTGTVVYADDRGIKRRSVFRRQWDRASQSFVRLTGDQERDNEYAD